MINFIGAWSSSVISPRVRDAVMVLDGFLGEAVGFVVQFVKEANGFLTKSRGPSSFESWSLRLPWWDESELTLDSKDELSDLASLLRVDKTVSIFFVLHNGGGAQVWCIERRWYDSQSSSLSEKEGIRAESVQLAVKYTLKRCVLKWVFHFCVNLFFLFLWLLAPAPGLHQLCAGWTQLLLPRDEIVESGNLQALSRASLGLKKVEMCLPRVSSIRFRGNRSNENFSRIWKIAEWTPVSACS